MILIRNLRLDPDENEKKLRRLAAKALRVDEAAVEEFRIVRKSLDARRRNDIHWVYSVAAAARGAAGEAYTPFRYAVPRAASERRPVIVGFGPAGMFAALVLAEAGLKPIVLERGADETARREAVRRFWEGGALDPETNVQFGAGGAGAFSDGKLATGIHDPRTAWVLEKFRDFGAPESVVYDAKPHVGTDRLFTVVRSLRQRVEALGGEVRFLTRFDGFETDKDGLRAVRAGGETLPCRDLVLAVGHSARDTFEALCALGIPMEQKPFAMGVRVEHKQAAVDAAQYGGPRGRNLPPADYALAVRLPDGRSAYTFCMCPGGYVVSAASEHGGVVTNGMSYSGRAGENANAALLSTVTPADFPGEGVLAGAYWQREIEQNCFDRAGAYRAPAQTVGDFLAAVRSVGPGAVAPSCRPGVHWGELREVLPPVLTEALAAAIPEMARKLRFFADPGAVLTAPETRSSSPVRILRDRETLQSAVPGLYPCGEGAGYAGGITSAAVDGMKCAERIIGRYR